MGTPEDVAAEEHYTPPVCPLECGKGKPEGVHSWHDGPCTWHDGTCEEANLDESLWCQCGRDEITHRLWWEAHPSGKPSWKEGTTMKHDCGNVPNGLSLEDRGEGWFLYAGDDRGANSCQFCPYCGEPLKLDDSYPSLNGKGGKERKQ